MPDSPADPSPAAQALAPAAQPLPTLSDNFGRLTNDLAVEEAQVSADIADRNSAETQLKQDRTLDAAESANAEVGPIPKVFDQPIPQEHFETVMGQAPLLMALAAIGGSLGRHHGLNMLASTNAMMKGLVQGSDSAYQRARKQYDEQYSQYQDKQKMWFDVYKAYQSAYKGRIDVDEKSITAANRAVGVDSAPLKMTRAQIAALPEVQAKIAKMHADITHMSAQDMVAMMRATTAQENADTKKEGKKTSSADSIDKAKGLLGTIDELEGLIDDNNFVTGFGGTGRKLYEFVTSSLTGSTDLPATNFSSKTNLLLLQAPEVLKVRGRMGKDQREKLDAAVSGLKSATSGPQAKVYLENLREILNDAAKPDVTQQPSHPGQLSTKTIGGKTYEKRADGQWYPQ